MWKQTTPTTMSLKSRLNISVDCDPYSGVFSCRNDLPERAATLALSSPAPDETPLLDDRLADRKIMEDSSPNRLFAAEIESDGQRCQLFHFDERDHIFRIARDTRKFYEHELLVSLRTYLNRDDHVIDVGANVGNHSIYWGALCGCRVTAFEPNPIAYRLLRLNVEHNHLSSRVELHHTALGEQSGLGDIDDSKAAHNLGAASIK